MVTLLLCQLCLEKRNNVEGWGRDEEGRKEERQVTAADVEQHCEVPHPASWRWPFAEPSALPLPGGSARLPEENTEREISRLSMKMFAEFSHFPAFHEGSAFPSSETHRCDLEGGRARYQLARGKAATVWSLQRPAFQSPAPLSTCPQRYKLRSFGSSVR